MADKEQENNNTSNGNNTRADHDEYQYLDLVKKIIDTGKIWIKSSLANIS